MTPERHSTALRLIGACFALSLAACASSPAPASESKPGPSVSAPAPPASATFRPDTTLSLCPNLSVSNAPPVDASRAITGYAPFVKVENRVVIAVSPVNGGCLTSGFGIRSTSPHKGVDYQVKPASMVHAAAAGRILEAGWRDDYGNYVVIDHGSGVFTRYAHLAALEAGVSADKTAPFGMPLGVMGNSSKYTLPVHLHYELLVGDYNTPKKSFGLMPVNVFGYPFERGLS
jgi:murein DD-endopeptidase MepM/ murein hydrolase activator NlpD